MTASCENAHFVINPASGKDEPILNVINSVLHEHGVAWEAHITHAAGDATRLTRRALDEGADLIVSYGGDGTLMEVINGMIGSEVPLGILPGGTGNAVAIELGVPEKLRDAVEVAITSDSYRRLDLGLIGDRYFVLRVFTGITENQIASRELKDKYGLLAYPISALRFVQNSTEALYTVTVDGKQVACKAMLAYVDNIGSIGGVRPLDLLEPMRQDVLAITGRKTYKADVDPWDGLLDVILISTEANEMVALASYLLNVGEARKHVTYWQGKQIRIEAEPAQTVWIDGEIYGETPVDIEAVPAAVRVILPPDSPHASKQP